MQSIHDLFYGFGVALEWHNLLWCFIGVLIGNIVGVLPGMGVLATMSILLPFTYTMQPVAAILMLAGIFYGSQYGGAIGAILLNLPSHPPHAITCIDGFPMTQQGRGGKALGITMLSSFVAASIGIIVMVFASQFVVNLSTKFGPPEMFAIMFFGLIMGSTLSKGSVIKSIAMVALGLFFGCVGTDVNSGDTRFTFGVIDLYDGVELVALAMGIFALADFMINPQGTEVHSDNLKIRGKQLWPSWREIRETLPSMLRGTAVGTFFGMLPGTGTTIASFTGYAVERKFSKHRELMGKGAIGGVAAPECATHAKTQVDFVPTMTLGIPGDAMMALILGALIIQGIDPGPLLINDHPDIFWGLVSSFWIGNVLLLALNMPLIGIWINMLRVPYRILMPCAILFITIGVYSTQNNPFQVIEVLFFGILGTLFLLLDFPIAPVLLGFILGPMIEENFRRTMLLSNGHLGIFISHPISLSFIGAALLILIIMLLHKIKFSLRK